MLLLSFGKSWDWNAWIFLSRFYNLAEPRKSKSALTVFCGELILFVRLSLEFVFNSGYSARRQELR